MNICEIFHSCQMEGPTIGFPTVFIRTFGCNLHCRFNGVSCDTPYAMSGTPKKMTIAEIVNEVQKYSQCKRITISGGESFIQMKELELLITHPALKDYFIEVETNGTIEPSDILKKRINQFNVSPKLISSNQILACEIIRIGFRACWFPQKKTTFKFVISNPQDELEIEEFIIHNPKANIMLMPQGETRVVYLENAPMVVELCKKWNVRYSPREHIVIYDKKRGV